MTSRAPGLHSRALGQPGRSEQRYKQSNLERPLRCVEWLENKLPNCINGVIPILERKHTKKEPLQCCVSSTAASTYICT